MAPDAWHGGPRRMGDTQAEQFSGNAGSAPGSHEAHASMQEKAWGERADQRCAGIDCWRLSRLTGAT